jgi:hypothetical protein
MTEEELLRKIIREAVHETLSGLGFNLANLQEMQADLLYLHYKRKSSEEMMGRIRLSVITVVIPLLLYLVWEAVKLQVMRG